MRDAWWEATLHKVLSALACPALALSALPTWWRHQDPTTMPLYGAEAGRAASPGPAGAPAAHPEATPVAPRPAYGENKDGPPELTPVVRSLAVSGDRGLPVRLGRRAGPPRESPATPRAIGAGLAWGLPGGRGGVAESNA